MTKSTINIGLFEDNPALSMGVSAYLTSQSTYPIEIVLNCTTPKEFIQQFKKQQPDLLIMDVVSEGTWGTELFEKVLKLAPDARIIAYSNVKNQRLIQSLLGLGVKAFIPKTSDLSDFDKAIKAIFEKNTTYVPMELSHLLKGRKKAIVTSLTKREKEVLQLLIEGKSSKEIASELFISVNTADFHKKNLFSKFEVANIAALVKESMSQGFSPDGHHI